MSGEPCSRALNSFAYDSSLSSLFGDHDAWLAQCSHLFAEDECSSHGSAAPPNDTNTPPASGFADEKDESQFLDMDGLGALQDHVFDLRTDSYRPPVACNHCRTHRLQCLVIRTTSANPNPITACSSCVALFRHCSLAEKPKRGAGEFETNYPVISNLHGIPEAAPSKTMNNALGKSEDLGVRAKRTSSRLRGRTKALRHWFACHMDHPFPSDEEKVELTDRSGLTRTQVDNWFTNARRRQKTLTQTLTYRHGSPIPQSTLADLTPFQRWRHSPPETEHVALELVERAASLQPSPPNTSSLDEARIHGSDSSFTASAAYSDSSESISSFGTLLSLGSHSEDSLVPTIGTATPSVHARYQCTFCPLSFKKSSDWSRHETSIHIQLETWLCQPHDPIVWPIGGSAQPRCNYCGASPPSQAHLASHDFQACAERPAGERTFARKDHLLQHLKKFHGCRKWAGQNLCVRPRTTSVNSRCGFCGVTFDAWRERERHLAEHFRQGWQMGRWVGDWGLDKATTQALKRATLPSERSKSCHD
jgi:Homeobox KN domain